MLTQIDVVCDETFTLSVLGAKPRDSFILEQVTGLGPPDKDLFVGDYASDGGLYTGRRVGNRNVVFTITPNPNYKNGETVSSLRNQLYKAFNDPFTTADDVQINLYDDMLPERYLLGYCDKFTGEVFGSDTSVQISLICPDPYIEDLVEQDLTPPEGSTWQLVPFTYTGTAETGFEAWLQVVGYPTQIVLDNNGYQMMFNYTFQDGDILYVNTNPGDRQITLTRGTDPALDVAYTLDPTSPWLFLHAMSNQLQVIGGTAGITELKFRPKYWGA